LYFFIDIIALMVKSLSKFVCQQCGHEETKWFGRCPDCGEWNSAVETVTSAGGKKPTNGSKSGARPIPLNSITTKQTARASTKISELDNPTPTPAFAS